MGVKKESDHLSDQDAEAVRRNTGKITHNGARYTGHLFDTIFASSLVCHACIYTRGSCANEF